MERLHAYWRFEYVQVPPEDRNNDIFERLPKEQEDQKSLILTRTPHSYLVLNRYPYNPGHLLAIPFRRVASLAQLSVPERNDLMEILARGETILQKALKPDGFNVGFNLGKSAGAGIPSHLHGHLVPRWEGDTNFMPVLGQTRVLAQALEEMWAHLRHHL
jgi:ATP adenylyltransferase